MSKPEAIVTRVVLHKLDFDEEGGIRIRWRPNPNTDCFRDLPKDWVDRHQPSVGDTVIFAMTGDPLLEKANG